MYVYILLSIFQPVITACLPVIANMSEACDFSKSTWLRSLKTLEKESHSVEGPFVQPVWFFFKVLVNGALKREDAHDAHAKVLRKTLENPVVTNTLVSFSIIFNFVCH